MNRNLKSFHYVYLTVNKINGKKYIGQHSTDNPADVYIGSGRKFLSEVKKYGKPNFEKTILEYAKTADDLDSLETRYIKKYETMYPNGYNMTSGGESKKEYSEKSLKLMSEKAKMRPPMSAETREKISKSGIGRVFSEESKKKKSKSLKGRVFSEEHRKKISESHKGMKKPWVKGGPGCGVGGPGCGGLFGEKNGMYGKHHTEESKKIISEKTSLKLKGRIFSEDHKRKISEAKKGKSTFEKGIGHKQRFINIYGDKLGSEKYEKFIKKQSEAKIGKKSIYKRKSVSLTEEHKNKLSNSLRGIKHKMKIIKCDHCGLEGKGGNMTRYHFDNCKQKNLI